MTLSLSSPEQTWQKEDVGEASRYREEVNFWVEDSLPSVDITMASLASLPPDSAPRLSTSF